MKTQRWLNISCALIFAAGLTACAAVDTKTDKAFVSPHVKRSAGKTQFGPLPPEFMLEKPTDESAKDYSEPIPKSPKTPEVVVRLNKLGTTPKVTPKISLNMKNASIKEVVRLLSSMSGMRFFVHPDAKKVNPLNLTLSEVSWEEALKIILDLSGLVASIDGEDLFLYHKPAGTYEKERVIVINTYDNFIKNNEKRKQSAKATIEIAEQRRKAEEERSATARLADSVNRVTISYRFRYADPNEALTYLEKLFIDYEKKASKDISRSTSIDYKSKPVNRSGKRNVDTNLEKALDRNSVILYRKRGGDYIKFSIFNPENLITITAPSRKIGPIMERIHDIDVKPRQVYIVARIVEIQRNHVKELGIQWGGYGMGVANNVFPHTVGVAGASDSSGNVIALPPQSAIDPATGELLPSSQGASLGITLGHISGAAMLNARLFALEQEGVSRTVSNPKVMAINGARATIKSGREIPYQASSANTGVTIRFKEAVIALTVTPLIMQDDRIRMKIETRKDEVDTALSVQGTPSIKKKELTTRVVVQSGGSVVLGGVFEGEEGGFQDRIPWAHKIPLLGWLFKNDRKVDNQLELLIFITPTIVEQG